MFLRMLTLVAAVVITVTPTAYADDIWEYLNDEDDARAIEGLRLTASLPDEEALPYLLYAVVLQRTPVAKEAGRLLAERRIPDAFDELVEMLDTDDRRTREAVSTGLMGYQPEEYFDEVVELLGDISPRRRVFAVEYIAAYGADEKVELLEGYLEDPNENVRLAAVIALKDEDVDVVPVALELFSSETTKVVIDAISAIADKTDPRAFDPLLALLDHKYTNVVLPAADALFRYEGDEYVDRFAELSTDVDEETRAFAVRWLSASGGERAIPHIMARLVDPKVQVVVAAVQGLLDLEYRDAGYRFQEMLANIDYADEIRFAAMRALAEMGIEGSEPIIADILTNPSELAPLRTNAAIALSFFKNDYAFEVLYNEAEAGEADSPTKMASVKALGIMGDERALPLLMELADEPYGELDLYGHIVAAIGMIGGPDAYEYLYGEYRDNDMSEKRYGSVVPYALAICGDERGPDLVIEELTRLYAEDETVGSENDETIYFRIAAVTGLGESGDADTADAVAMALKDPDERVVMAALRAAGNLFDIEMLPLIKDDERLNTGKIALFTMKAVEAIEERCGASGE
ncbi:MAG: HEAT repeat domain-containing protein [Candidatus Coatesbacteria bacterium]|nr:MAG: HEAT repeat domain-containing protein [Candidatus Coatesbacteria bacterium]